jgi:hypothetical protein
MKNLGLEITGFACDYHITRFQAMTAIAIIGATITVAIQTYLLEQKIKGNSIISPILNLLPFIVFLPSSFLWCYYSDIALALNPITSVLLISATFTEMVSHIMLMHICDDEISPVGRVTSFLMVLLPLHVWCSHNNPSESFNYFHGIVLMIDETTLIQVLASFSLLFTGMKLFLVRFHSLNLSGSVYEIFNFFVEKFFKNLKFQRFCVKFVCILISSFLFLIFFFRLLDVHRNRQDFEDKNIHNP